MNDFLRKITKEVRLELHDEFDKNFTRKAFFDTKWKPRSREGRGSLLVTTGRLRRGLRSASSADTIRFSHDAPYAKIHNEGGKIKVTPKMRKFFWAMYYKNMQGVAFNIKTRETANKSSRSKNDKATYWRNMALNKKGEINIPKRQYIGSHPRVDKSVEKIVTTHITNYFKNLDKHFKR